MTNFFSKFSVVLTILLLSVFWWPTQPAQAIDNSCKSTQYYTLNLLVTPTSGNKNSDINLAAVFAWSSTAPSICIATNLRFDFGYVAPDLTSGAVASFKEVKIGKLDRGQPGAASIKLQLQQIGDLKGLADGRKVTFTVSVEDDDLTGFGNDVTPDIKGSAYTVRLQSDQNPSVTASRSDGDINVKGLDFGFKIKPPNAWTNLSDMLASLANFVFQLGTMLAVILIVYNGFLYMTSGGDVSKTKKARMGIFYSVLGLGVLIIGKGFVSLIMSLIDALGKSGGG